ncbi:hypothetical protein KIH74_07800 [Kineosporia sp. J2-2]|uniref:FlgD/Vpr Ig-like domain-containing protein n=1 Tax=Kineosporia corallincola TaxID=2835133 RepID=A0ABS5TCL2_9ACTN|nr:FlgD immunoglobulin-like domain containing protein [Kineosporia corallincola]MBT0768825.1 hypothetical protein [Kineosporia corallincola]
MPDHGSSRPRRGAPILAMAAAVLAATLASALLGPAANAADNATDVPLHPAPQVNLSMLGGSDRGYAVQMEKPIPGRWGVYTGGPGDRLTERTVAVPQDRPWDATYLGVVGQQLGYVVDFPGTVTRYEMHRLNVLTGNDTALGTVTTRPVAFTADSWLSFSDGWLVSTRFADGTATRVAETGTMWHVELTTNGMLIETTNDARSEWYLDLVDFDSGTRRRVATEAQIYQFSVSPTTMVWTANPEVGKPQVVKVQDRSSGQLFTYLETDDYADATPKVAGDHGAAYVVPRVDSWKLRTVTPSGVVSTVDLPDYAEGLAADGPRWLLGVRGRTGDAGVWAVRDGAAAQVATVAAPDTGVTGISFAAGRIYYADNATYDDGTTPLDLSAPMSVWSRPVTGLGAPVLGDETELEQRSAHLLGDSSLSMSFSAGRGVVSGVVTGSQFTWRLLDRGRTTATVRQPFSFQPTGEYDTRYPNVSGPYLVAAGHVYDPGGKLLYSRPGAASGEIGYHDGNDDLYGPRLIYTRDAKKSGYQDIWLRDLDRPKSASNPGRLGSVKVSSPKVAIWGNTVAWQSGSREISLRTLSSTKVRKVRITGPLVELTLGEGVLAWNANAKTYALSTVSSTSVPWALAAAGRTIRVDDHYLARRVSTGAVVVYRMYTGDYHPRLIGTFAPAGFTPNGDGRADTWNPQFDLSKPVDDVQLVVRSTKTGSVLRTLTGTGPDGSIRDLAFDGRNGSGKPLANGTYSWQLTASAKDGEGAVIGIRGEKKVTGTVKIGKVGS